MIKMTVSFVFEFLTCDTTSLLHDDLPACDTSLILNAFKSIESMSSSFLRMSCGKTRDWENVRGVQKFVPARSPLPWLFLSLLFFRPALSFLLRSTDLSVTAINVGAPRASLLCAELESHQETLRITSCIYRFPAPFVDYIVPSLSDFFVDNCSLPVSARQARSLPTHWLCVPNSYAHHIDPRACRAIRTLCWRGIAACQRTVRAGNDGVELFHIPSTHLVPLVSHAS